MDLKAPRINLYRCQTCNKVTATVDVNLGSTALALVCPACNGIADTLFYPEFENNLAKLTLPRVVYEFYRPDILNTGNIASLDEGELLIRERTSAEPVTNLMYLRYINILKATQGYIDFRTHKEIERDVRIIT